MSELKETSPEENARVSAGLTVGIGDYQNIKIHISISDDQRKGEKVSEAVDRVYGWVEHKMQEKINAQNAENG